MKLRFSGVQLGEVTVNGNDELRTYFGTVAVTWAGVTAEQESMLADMRMEEGVTVIISNEPVRLRTRKAKAVAPPVVKQKRGRKPKAPPAQPQGQSQSTDEVVRSALKTAEKAGAGHYLAPGEYNDEEKARLAQEGGGK